jgi:hypothetical protein
MRYLHCIFLLLMVLFMAVQYNDPDGLMWMLIYAVPALWSGVAVFWHLWFDKFACRVLLMLSVVASFAGVVYFWPLSPKFWTKAVWLEVETAREGMGLMIVAFVLLITWYSGRRQSRRLAAADFRPH